MGITAKYNGISGSIVFHHDNVDLCPKSALVVPALKLGKERGANANDIFLLKQNLDIMFP